MDVVEARTEDIARPGFKLFRGAHRPWLIAGGAVAAAFSILLLLALAGGTASTQTAYADPCAAVRGTDAEYGCMLDNGWYDENGDPYPRAVPVYNERTGEYETKYVDDRKAGQPINVAPAPDQADSPPEAGPSPATPNSAWSDPALWEMDCTSSANPSKVDVHHVATGDLTDDGRSDTVVAASCIAGSSAWPDSVTLFDGASSDSATFINADTAARRPIVDSLTIEGGEIVVEGTLLSRNAPLCCSDLRFSDKFVVTAEEWRRTSHEVWPNGQSEPAANTPTDAEDRVGYGDVKIGMSRRELLATGETTGKASGGCSWYNLSYGGEAVFSSSLGQVVAIFYQGDMTTSKGIHLGSTKAEVIAAYPEHGRDMHGYWTTEITSGVDYVIGISGGRVSQLILESNDQNCYG